MKTQRFTVRNSSLFDSRGYDIPALRAQLAGMVRNVRSRRWQSNLPAQITFELSQGVTTRAVAEKLAELLGRTPFVDAV